MKNKDICIIVAAQGISSKTIQRFKQSVVSSGPNFTYDILVKGGREKKFYKTRIINECLRKAIPHYKVIIQTDVDLIVPPRLINETMKALQEQPRNCFHHFLRYINPKEIKNKTYQQYPWGKWMELKPTFCSGCWNGMTSQMWAKSGGFNEEMYAWGSEDTEFYNRSKRKGIRWINRKNFPLVHVNHPRRQKKRAKENSKVGKEFSDQTDWLTRSIIRRP